MKLTQAIEEFKNWRGFKVTGHTVVRYDSALRIFCLTIGDVEIEQIQIQHVLHYLKQMELLGWKRNGVNIVALALRKFFEFYNLQGYRCLNESLIPLPKKEFNIPRVANEKDFNKLVKSIPRDRDSVNIRNLALVHMVWDTWARSGEIISLDGDDLQFNKDGSGFATIKTEKSRGKRPIREIFWTAQTNKYLKAWLKEKERIQDQMVFEDVGAVFISIRKCGPYDVRGKRMTNRGVCEVFRTISNRAGLPSIFNAHSARHYGGRKIIKDGGASADVTNILGHSNLESSQFYTMMWGNDLRERWTHFHNEHANPKHDKGRLNKNLKSIMSLNNLDNAKEVFESFIEYMQKDNVPTNDQFVNRPKRNTVIDTGHGGRWSKF
ncbi:MAG TPA: tyrosine-type recombinase/integrase [Candidatus Paceibacterota bacterium]|nr:tyrosine-type recombinase/integrase [Candidatus Paceibacterota bacterium]